MKRIQADHFHSFVVADLHFADYLVAVIVVGGPRSPKSAPTAFDAGIEAAAIESGFEICSELESTYSMVICSA